MITFLSNLLQSKAAKNYTSIYGYIDIQNINHDS